MVRVGTGDNDDNLGKRHSRGYSKRLSEDQEYLLGKVGRVASRIKCCSVNSLDGSNGANKRKG